MRDVGRCTLELDLELLLGGLHTVVVYFPGVTLFLDISLFSKMRIELEHRAFERDDRLLALAEAQLEIIDFCFVFNTLVLHFSLVALSQRSNFINFLLILRRHLLSQPLNFLLELLNLLYETIMQLLLQLSVLLYLGRNLHDLNLQFFAGGLAVLNELLVFSDVFLQIIVDLKLFVKSNERVQLVLKLNLLFF